MMDRRVGRIWHVSRTGLQFAKLHARKRPSQNQLMVTEIQALTDQCSMTHSSRIVNCPSRTCLFQSLSIEELTLDCEFKVVNALVIDNRWLWGFEIPLRFLFGIIGRFRRLLGGGQREGGSGGHV
jgi:hypothetical protein